MPNASHGPRKWRSPVHEYLEKRLCFSVSFPGHLHHSIAPDRITEAAVADFDTDGDLDVIAPVTTKGITRLTIFENVDGKGTFRQGTFVTQEPDQDRSPRVADLDGDGDADIVAAAQDGKVVWYENTGGKGIFGSRRVIDAMASDVRLINVADLDQDGDLDVLAAFSENARLVWYENSRVFGVPGFGLPRVMANESTRALTLDVADMDGDGDTDVLASFSGTFEDRITWFANLDGEGAFGRSGQTIENRDSFGEYPTFRPADMDGDGDIDVVAASSTWTSSDKIVWHANVDGRGKFGPQQIVSEVVLNPKWIDAVDLDGDNDLDLISASSGDDRVTWYENVDGLGGFGQSRELASRADAASFVTTADFDNDGDRDILIATDSSSGGLAWYERRLIGDANNDGYFNSADFVQVFQAGEFEDNIRGNSTFEDGDWNGDGEFDTSDFVAAFQSGDFELLARAARKREAATDWLFAEDTTIVAG